MGSVDRLSTNVGAVWGTDSTSKVQKPQTNPLHSKPLLSFNNNNNEATPAIDDDYRDFAADTNALLKELGYNIKITPAQIKSMDESITQMLPVLDLASQVSVDNPIHSSIADNTNAFLAQYGIKSEVTPQQVQRMDDNYAFVIDPGMERAEMAAIEGNLTGNQNPFREVFS